MAVLTQDVTVAFPERATLRQFERLMADSWKLSTNARRVRFDLSETKWCGYYPATMLFSWISHLISDRSTEVIVTLPEQGTVSTQVANTLFGSGIAHQLARKGVGFGTLIESSN